MMEGVMKARFSVAALALAGALAVSATAANATTTVFNFGATSAWDGIQANVPGGQSVTYTLNGLSVTLTAFGLNNASGSPVQLYGKNQGPGETGIGLTNDPSGEHEIYYREGFIQIDLSGIPSADLVSLSFGSTTGGEEWKVDGTNTAGTLLSITPPGSSVGTGFTNGSLTLTGHDRYYDVFEISQPGWGDGGNILLSSLTVTSVPEPATWGLMIAGVFCIGAAMRRQRRSAFAAV
jgi:hypothetical protein